MRKGVLGVMLVLLLAACGNESANRTTALQPTTVVTGGSPEELIVITFKSQSSPAAEAKAKWTIICAPNVHWPHKSSSRPGEVDVKADLTCNTADGPGAVEGILSLEQWDPEQGRWYLRKMGKVNVLPVAPGKPAVFKPENLIAAASCVSGYYRGALTITGIPAPGNILITPPVTRFGPEVAVNC